MLAVMSLPFAAQKCKRYDMIAAWFQTVPKAHHNLEKPIITLNSPQAIIVGDLLCGRLAKAILQVSIMIISVGLNILGGISVRLSPRLTASLPS